MSPREEERALRALLVAPGREHLELPSLSDLTAAATALARGQRRKALLPLASAPTEWALVRRGPKVLVSAYDTLGAPEVHQLDHEIELERLLRGCAHATLEDARYSNEKMNRQIAEHLAERALRTPIAPDPEGLVEPVIKRGGLFEAPDDDVPLAFGFEATLHPNAAAAKTGASRADVHALLFDGQLWAYVRGRRLPLGRGPFMLAVQRMVCGVRALVDAWEAGRAANVRLRSGPFAIGLRLTLKEEVALSLQSGRQEVRATELDVPSVALPILRLANDGLRALVTVDRSQAKNLRVQSLRDEVRALRRVVRDHARDDGFVNAEPERVRVATAEVESAKRPAPPAPTTSLRFEERWRVDMGELDAASTWFCGDRLVLASPQHTVAVDRGTGEVLWAREGARTCWMAGTALMRVLPEGELEVCGVQDGEPQSIARLSDPAPGPKVGVVAGDDGLPPLAILADGPSHLVALDLRTGEPRWRFSCGRTQPSLTRAGRLLLVAGEGAVHALDVASGEDLWRFAARGRFTRKPIVIGDTVVALTEGGAPTAYGIDLFTGERRWRERLSGAPVGDPLSAQGLAIVPLARDQLVALDAVDGSARWLGRDPGVATGAALVVDDLLVVNAPGGALGAIELNRGEVVWSVLLADPLADEVPRCLEPVLRGGALFVPAGGVHVIRPSDGAKLGELPTDLVPDRVRVDERGWVYVAEESGHVAAYAPAPQLRMIRGGG
ncbi:MAG: PQQ-binding-like beta-propeller repeat protein [Sandaracinus sp.]|nr:PQQ-binding-like beta-propeller repeat protein [Sandaracinus sp.]MCB9624765.1 PQQ-binding-like beta-propeller repeat protein [Sandaracinus sp.]